MDDRDMGEVGRLVNTGMRTKVPIVRRGQQTHL